MLRDTLHVHGQWITAASTPQSLERVAALSLKVSGPHLLIVLSASVEVSNTAVDDDGDEGCLPPRTTRFVIARHAPPALSLPATHHPLCRFLTHLVTGCHRECMPLWVECKRCDGLACGGVRGGRPLELDTKWGSFRVLAQTFQGSGKSGCRMTGLRCSMRGGRSLC